MCTVDIGVFGSVWVDKSDPRPFTDFNTKHTCRNFKQIQAWAKERQSEDVEKLPDDFWEPIGDDVYVWDVAP
jgi:hypothetical protein